MKPYLEAFFRTVNVNHFTSFRNILCGAGIAYAVSEEKYTHIPLAVFIPSIYAGYQAYSNRAAILQAVAQLK
jgi:hypothetical protein